jgi:hypothetical protein
LGEEEGRELGDFKNGGCYEEVDLLNVAKTKLYIG